jgi:hypothetical protein
MSIIVTDMSVGGNGNTTSGALLSGPNNNGTVGSHYNFQGYLRWRTVEKVPNYNWPQYSTTSANNISVMNGNYIVNNTLVSSGITGSFSTSSNNVFLFNCTDGNLKSANKLFYVKLYDINNTLLRDFIPCYRKSDGVMGLYDKVEGKFYTNAGTGTFLKGSNINTSTTQTTNTNSSILQEYQEVEYIESTGTQWIDLNVKADSTTIITTDIQYSKIDNEFDNGYFASNNSRLDFGIYQNKWFFFYGSSYNWIYQTQSDFDADTNRHNIIYSLPNRTMQIDNIIVQPKYTCPLQTVDGENLHLFNRNGVVPANIFAKLYHFKMTKNNSLVRDMVPCYRKSDGVIGLYDKVEGKFYTNQGTGTFLKGEDVNNNTSTQTITKTIIKIISIVIIKYLE